MTKEERKLLLLVAKQIGVILVKFGWDESVTKMTKQIKRVTHEKANSGGSGS